MYNPLDSAAKLESIVSHGLSRRYYRIVRRDRWYGGICTSDCVGCNLHCVFCWSNKPRDFPNEIGRFFSPQDIFNALINCAKKNNINQLRISGNEPTIAKQHLFEILRLVDTTNYEFILETNGTLIDASYAKELSKFKNLHVRVSIKGTNPEEFSHLTGAYPDCFKLQLNALKNLLEVQVNFHTAVMLSFSTQNNLKNFKELLKKIHPSLIDNLEDEFVFLYSHVVKRLKKEHIKPNISYEPGKIPEELV